MTARHPFATAPPATEAELEALAAEAGLTDAGLDDSVLEALDEAVHEVKADEAAGINNQGVAAQVAYLCAGMPLARARLYLQDLAHTAHEERA